MEYELVTDDNKKAFNRKLNEELKKRGYEVEQS
jgi:hypothetical protein